SESNLNSAANGTRGWPNFDHGIAIVDARLKIKKIARIDDCFRPDRQAKRRQVLGDLDTQRRIVNSQTSRERINGEDCRLRRKAKHRLHVSSGRPITGYLHGRGLEEPVAE